MLSSYLGVSRTIRCSVRCTAFLDPKPQTNNRHHDEVACDEHYVDRSERGSLTASGHAEPFFCLLYVRSIRYFKYYLVEC